ncbi:hypothetical protein JW721_01725 [Candidatus Micrarchaeota archaeon]|nr:hypothetical protein [Candidatus Micrarchaeota archaeon]
MGRQKDNKKGRYSGERRSGGRNYSDSEGGRRSERGGYSREGGRSYGGRSSGRSYSREGEGGGRRYSGDSGERRGYSGRSGGRDSYRGERGGGEGSSRGGYSGEGGRYSREGGRSDYRGDRREGGRSYGGRSPNRRYSDDSGREDRGGYSSREGGRKRYDKREGGSRGRRPEGGGGFEKRGFGNKRSFGREREEGSFGSGFGAGFDRDKFMKKAREQTTEVLRSRDMYLAYLSNAIEEEERVANQLVERLEELYGLYFPELKVEDRRNYALIISKITRDKVDINAIKAYVGEGKAIQISEAGKKSIGGDFEEKDVENMQKMALEIESIYALMNRHEKYLDDVSQQVCPNLRYLIGAKVACKLISAAGGLKKLAVMPASTVQVIGAEKALFKHLRNRNIAPPKHGIIFQHNSISTSPKSVRGKIARALATKIALAVKADVYTKRFIGPLIKDKFEKRLKDILAKAPRRPRETEDEGAY